MWITDHNSHCILNCNSMFFYHPLYLIQRVIYFFVLHILHTKRYYSRNIYHPLYLIQRVIDFFCTIFCTYEKKLFKKYISPFVFNTKGDRLFLYHFLYIRTKLIKKNWTTKYHIQRVKIYSTSFNVHTKINQKMKFSKIVFHGNNQEYQRKINTHKNISYLASAA